MNSKYIVREESWRGGELVICVRNQQENCTVEYFVREQRDRVELSVSSTAKIILYTSSTSYIMFCAVCNTICLDKFKPAGKHDLLAGSMLGHKLSH